jgi:hypothetical protein
MQQEDQGQWCNAKVKKANGIKPGVYNIYAANKADKTKEYSGVILFADKTTAYQQVGKGQYIIHDQGDFAKPLEPGEIKSISYSADGQAVFFDSSRTTH